MKYIWSVFLICFAWTINACDGCNFYSSIYDSDYKHSLGIYFQKRIHEGELPSGLKHLSHISGLYSTDLLSENYNTVEIRGRYRISERIALFGALPIHSRYRYQNGLVREMNEGFGDPIVLAEYRPILSKSDNLLKLQWISKLGIKAPLGSTQKKYGDDYLDHDFQLGSGSYDYLIQNEFFLEKRDIGIALAQMYKYNTANLSGYTFGNVILLEGMMSYRKEIREKNLIMACGLQFEHRQNNERKPEVFEQTESKVLSGVCRVYLSNGENEFYIQGMLPIRQQFNRLETLPLKYMMQVGVNFLIDKR